MPDTPHRPDDIEDRNPPEGTRPEQHLLSDDRAALGGDFSHPTDPSLERSFIDSNRGRDVETVGDQFADSSLADRHRLGESFADPNSADDTRIGESFIESNSSGKHKKKAPKKPSPPGSHRVFYLVLLGLAVVLLIVFFAGFLPRHERDKHNAEKSRDEQKATPVVDVIKVTRPDAGAPLVVPGTTTPLVEAYLYARANGYLKARYVDIGDRVHKGQLLAIIDSPDLDQQVDQAREQLRQAQQQQAQEQAQLALQRVTNARYQVLVGKGVLSRQEGDQQATNFNAALATDAAAQRNVDAYRANLGRVIALQDFERVRAPFDGIVTQRNVDVGALISTSGNGQGNSTPMSPPTGGTTTGAATNTGGSTGSGPTAVTPQNSGNNGGPLFAIAQVDRLRILVSVPEGYVGSVRRGAPAFLHFQEFPVSSFPGTVTRTAGSIDQNTRTMLTEVQVPNKDGKLLNGMYAVASFAPTAPGQGPITISGDAIAVRNGQNVVGVVQGDTVHVVPVQVGRDFGAAIEILSGLKVGDLVAQTFTDDVTEGRKVDAKLQVPPGSQTKFNVTQSQPPGGSTQYGDQAITDRNMQGVSGEKSQKTAQGKPPQSSKGDSQP